MEVTEAAPQVEKPVRRWRVVFQVGVEPVGGPQGAGIELRRRGERPAPAHRQAELAPDEDVLDVEVVADPRTDGRWLDPHRPPAPDAAPRPRRRGYRSRARPAHRGRQP